MSRKLDLFPTPWFVRRHVLGRWRDITSAHTRRGLGWLLTEMGDDSLIQIINGFHLPCFTFGSNCPILNININIT